METIIAENLVEMDLDALIAELPVERQRAIRRGTFEMELQIFKRAGGVLPVFTASGARLAAVLPDGQVIELQGRDLEAE